MSTKLPTRQTELSQLMPVVEADWLTRLVKGKFLERLNLLKFGRLTIVDGKEHYHFGEKTADFPVTSTIVVHHQRMYRQLAFGGTVGAGESFMEGDWTTDNLTGVIQIFVRNRSIMEAMDSGWAKITEPFLKLYHWKNRNTTDGSRKNISAHYDMGNDFFELFLDPTMTYSAGVFASKETTLEEASNAKYDRLCQKLKLNPEDHLLEIGTGWGGMAIHAAKNYGCRVTTTTISTRQHEYAKKRIAEEGLEDRITLLFEDYRNLTGVYTKCVSIEMIEAVGAEFFETYFKKISDLLTDDGLLAIQAITIQDQNYEQARKSVDFIKRFIFPGCCIPSTTALMNAATRATDMTLFHLEDNTPNYARTLKLWREAMFENKQKILACGYSEELIRLWDFYLSYCEGGFWERSIGNIQFVMRKPLSRHESILPDLT